MRALSRFLILFFCFICYPLTNVVLAQSAGFLEAQVFNSATSEPVPFATIKLKSNQLSVYSNEEGDFRLIKNPGFQTDSVIITCVGYKKYSIAFKNLKDEEINKIHIAPSKPRHDEIKIAARDAKLNSVSIIRRALGNLNTRYPVKPFNYISYYRDYQKKDSNYINLNEALIQTVDSGFNSGSGSNIYRLLAFRKNTGFLKINFSPVYKASDSTVNKISDSLIPDAITRDQYGNELLNLMSRDPIRYFNTRSFSFIEIFSENFINNHNFSSPSEVFDDNLLLYKITFNGRTSIIGDSLLVSGAIYIQPDDYSIHKLEYSCYKNKNGKGLKKIFSFELEYGYDDTTNPLMCLKYISFCRLFNVIDMADDSYFRLSKFRWDIFSNINPTLALSFNNKLDPVIASRKENYTIMVGKRVVKIKNIQVAGENLFIRFNNDEVEGMADSCEVYFKVLKDVNGNIFGERKHMEIYQYRELFVQEFNKSLTLKDSSIEQYLPAQEDTDSAIGRKWKYWMNTPGINSKLSPEKLLPPL